MLEPARRLAAVSVLLVLLAVDARNYLAAIGRLVVDAVWGIGVSRWHDVDTTR